MSSLGPRPEEFLDCETAGGPNYSPKLLTQATYSSDFEFNCGWAPSALTMNLRYLSASLAILNPIMANSSVMNGLSKLKKQ